MLKGLLSAVVELLVEEFNGEGDWELVVRKCAEDGLLGVVLRSMGVVVWRRGALIWSGPLISGRVSFDCFCPIVAEFVDEVGDHYAELVALVKGICEQKARDL